MLVLGFKGFGISKLIRDFEKLVLENHQYNTCEPTITLSNTISSLSLQYI